MLQESMERRSATFPTVPQKFVIRVRPVNAKHHAQTAVAGLSTGALRGRVLA